MTIDHANDPQRSVTNFAQLVAKAAARRRRQLLLRSVPAAAALVAAVLLGLVVVQDIHGGAARDDVLNGTQPQFAAPVAVDALTRARLLAIADQQATLAGGTAVTVTALRTTRQAYEAATDGNGVPPNTPEHIWIVQATGGSYVCLVCLGPGPGAPRARITSLSLIVNADTDTFVDYQTGLPHQEPGQPAVPGQAIQLRP